MTTQEIKTAVDSGKVVNWKQPNYIVIKDTSNSDYLIKCTTNNSCIGLTWADGVTLNGNEEDFYVESKGIE